MLLSTSSPEASNLKWFSRLEGRRKKHHNQRALSCWQSVHWPIQGTRWEGPWKIIGIRPSSGVFVRFTGVSSWWRWRVERWGCLLLKIKMKTFSASKKSLHIRAWSLFQHQALTIKSSGLLWFQFCSSSFYMRHVQQESYNWNQTEELFCQVEGFPVVAHSTLEQLTFCWW